MPVSNTTHWKAVWSFHELARQTKNFTVLIHLVVAKHLQIIMNKFLTPLDICKVYKKY